MKTRLNGKSTYQFTYDEYISATTEVDDKTVKNDDGTLWTNNITINGYDFNWKELLIKLDFILQQHNKSLYYEYKKLYYDTATTDWLTDSDEYISYNDMNTFFELNSDRNL